VLRPLFSISALGLLAGAILASAALVSAPTAAAKPRVQVFERSLRLVLLTEASNDYSLGIETDGHRQVALTLSKGSGAVIYTTTGRVSRKGIEADFGALGEVSVRFHGKLLRRRRPSRRLDVFGVPSRGRGLGTVCRGRRAQVESGDFRGTIRFEGENGFSGIDASAGRGFVIRKYRRVCRTSQPHLHPKPRRHRGQDSKGADQARAALGGLRANLLTVGGEADGRRVFMRALSFDSGPKWLRELFGTMLIGATLERRDGIRIERVAMTGAGSNALTVSRGKNKPTRVSVVFPKPMEGRAELVQAKGSPVSWSGSLSMRLPGAGGVPLTGPGLAVVYCRISLAEIEESPCLPRSEALLPPESLSGSPRLKKLLALQESGSHSQALADAKLSWSR
jgi:hypothetical protein